MDCSDEVAAVQNALKMSEVKKIDANIMNETVTVYHDRSLSEQKIRQCIEKAGLKIVTESRKSFFHEHSKRIALVLSSGVCLGAGLLLDWIEVSNFNIFNSLYALSIILAGVIIFPKAWRSLNKLHLDMNVLMTIAVVGAIFIKEYSEAASVVFLFSLAELLEALSVARARKAIREVLKLTPKEALVLIENNKTVSRGVSDLRLGDLILVRPGDNIPIDGVIIEGSSSVNQASLTGESRAVDKNTGDTVFAGTINEAGVLKIEVTKLFQDSKISQIVSLIEEAQQQKAPSQRFVDKFASIYTPAVLLLALVVAIAPPLFFSQSWDEWIYKALVLLVIGCPCALVIATPVSVVSGLTSLARRGILVKGGIHLESLGKLRAIALDKTGTITYGTPEVSEMKIFSSVTEKEVIKIAASLESMSSHPLAKAMLSYADSKGIGFEHPLEFKLFSGKGAEGMLDGHMYFVGNHKLAHELGICGPEVEKYLDEIESKSMSVIVLGHKPHHDCKGEILAVFALGDRIRANIKDAISDFHNAGIEFVGMLSGDNQKTVNAVASQIGIDFAKGGLLPDDKVNEVKALVSKYQYVGMVGDGVNDAPALANATIGIAMGVVGSDTAIETADVALMKDDIFMLPKAIRHGKQVLNVIRFNIAFAIAIKAVFFLLAFLGMTNLWMAVAADMGASLLVTFNALRLLKIKD
jgi:Cd2+/Zn2+-exporting ATPase